MPKRKRGRPQKLGAKAKPTTLRIPPDLLSAIKISAKANGATNVSKEVFRLLKVALAGDSASKSAAADLWRLFELLAVVLKIQVPGAGPIWADPYRADALAAGIQYILTKLRHPGEAVAPTSGPCATLSPELSGTTAAGLIMAITTQTTQAGAWPQNRGEALFPALRSALGIEFDPNAEESFMWDLIHPDLKPRALAAKPGKLRGR